MRRLAFLVVPFFALAACSDSAGSISEGEACGGGAKITGGHGSADGVAAGGLDGCDTGLSCIEGVCTRDEDGDRIPDVTDICLGDPTNTCLNNGTNNNSTNNGTNNGSNNKTTGTNNNATNNGNNDRDGDGILDDVDNCPDVSNPNQSDVDGDGIGDVCDDDRDGDGTNNDVDNCPDTPNPDQADEDQDGIGDACDNDTTRRDGRPTNPNCTFTPPVGQFLPTLEWGIGVGQNDPYSDRDQVMMTPSVANLTDDNQDGVIDAMDIPDVIYVSFATNNDVGDFDLLQYGVLRAVSGDGTGLLTKADGTPWTVGHTELGLPNTGGFQPAGSVAVGDIDGDGFVEIISGIWDNDTETGGLVMINHDGTVGWTSSYEIAGVKQPRQFRYWWGGPSIADIDADGDAEIIIGNVVFDHNGGLVWDGNDNINLTGEAGQGINWPNGDSTRTTYTGTLSLVADLTPNDGNNSQHIVTGRTAYNADGTLLWEADAALPDGFPAIGDFNADGNPEVVVSANGSVRVHDGLTGVVVWGPVNIGGGRVGPPTVANFVGSDRPEVGVAGGNQYITLSIDLATPNATLAQARIWSATTQDASSNMTGSSVFDFEGDGKAEVVYNDELFLRVFSGETGAILFEEPNTSFTALEYPIIVDVDNDGAAEIVVGTNDFECGDQLNCPTGFSGLRVFGDGADNWVSTRRIWNQHTYHITNVTEVGAIPQVEVASWIDHNTYRLNAQSSIDPEAAPDLIGEDIDVTTDLCDVAVGVWVTNSGAERVGSGLPVAVFAVDANGNQTRIGAAVTRLPLEPGQSEKLIINVRLPNGGPYTIAVIVDWDGNDMSTKKECDETNNTVASTVPLNCAP